MTTRLIDGSAGDVLAGVSRDSQMLVVGHRGLGGFTGLLVGSVAAQVTGHARSPAVAAFVRAACAVAVTTGTDHGRPLAAESLTWPTPC